MKFFTKQNSILVIIIISIAGILFSGYLSYRELFTYSCNIGFVACGAKVGTLPACVYGLLMYSLVFIVSFFGYKSKK